MSITADKIVNKAISFLGTKEYPKNSNNVLFNTWYYGKEVRGSEYPWCCVFVSYIFNACNASDIFYGGKKSASCLRTQKYYESIGEFYPKTQGKRGDLCIMMFAPKQYACHIGIVEKKNADGTYTVIEGNTSSTSNDNGGCVMRRIRKQTNIIGFARPAYNTTYNKTQFIKDVQSTTGSKVDGIVGVETLSNVITVSTMKNNKHKVVVPIQKYLTLIGFECGTIDGIFGNKTYNAVRNYQKSKGLTIDGIIGKNTWKKLLS